MIDSCALIAPISPPLTGASSIDAAFLGDQRRQPLGRHRRDAAHVDDDGALLEARTSTPSAPVSTRSTSGVSGSIVMTMDDAARDLGGRRRRGGAGGDELVHGAAAAVVNDQRDARP